MEQKINQNKFGNIKQETYLRGILKTNKLKKMKHNKMTKQEFLDQETKTNEEWVTQTVLVNLSKTDIAQIRRCLDKLYNTAYKSWARSMPFEEILSCVLDAEELNKYPNGENRIE